MEYLAYHKMILLVYPFPQKSAIPYWYQIITISRIVHGEGAKRGSSLMGLPLFGVIRLNQHLSDVSRLVSR